MSYNYKRKTEKRDPAVMEAALVAIHNGSMVNKAAHDFDIPEKTLRDHYKAGLSGNPIAKCGATPCLPAHMEIDLAGIIKEAANNGFGFSKEEVKLFVADYVKKVWDDA